MLNFMLNFIQISDLHHHIKNYNSLKMRLSLVHYLTEMAEKTRFDFLVVTGDLVDKGSDFTDEIITYLDTILDAINLSRENIYIVPGNHDLKRDDTRNLIIDGINSKESASDNLDQHLAVKGTKDIILKSFDNFFDFYKNYFGAEYPTDQIHFIKDNDRYNIIHLNSCLVACRSGEEGSLFIGKSKLLECLSKLDKRQNKLNIAIGHHSLDCFHPDEINSIKANFEDYGVDMYLSGHVHKAGYHIEANGDSPFVNLVSGAGAIDDYAEGGFITGKIEFSNYDMKVEFHGWHKQQQYWTINTGVGRKAKTGTLNYTIHRLKGLENVIETNLHSDIEELSIDVDEDEFKNFIIDFHQHPQPKGTITVYQTKQKEIEEKFENMRCSPTFEKMFLDYAQYFSAIEEIMNSTSYIEAEKKEIVSEIIKDTYLGMHNNYSSGDEIFIKLVDIIEKNHTENLKYSVHKTRRYIRILTAWCIYDCSIFNEKKSKTGVM